MDRLNISYANEVTAMEYRSSNPTDHGFADEQEELVAMRDFVQGVMANSDVHAMCDSILVVANVCENRAVMLGSVPEMKKTKTWYEVTALMLRQLLLVQTYGSSAPKPNIKLENQILYFPDVEVMQ